MRADVDGPSSWTIVPQQPAAVSPVAPGLVTPVPDWLGKLQSTYAPVAATPVLATPVRACVTIMVSSR